MIKKHRVVFQGLIQDREEFKSRMVELGAPADVVDYMVRKAPVILRTDLTLGAARRYADAVQEAGGRVTIQEDGYFEKSKRLNPMSIRSFRDFTRCPQCGFKQEKHDRCIKCGAKLG